MCLSALGLGENAAAEAHMTQVERLCRLQGRTLLSLCGSVYTLQRFDRVSWPTVAPNRRQRRLHGGRVQQTRLSQVLRLGVLAGQLHEGRGSAVRME